ncbi:ATP-binding cassette domain-containing protein [Rhodococcus sp. BP-349]|uniref:ABC transporter ATP-binding protein n=1 Tax=unclassified Rhodococcus (in: high G+C Gram-positive bacteria) TaxID=192944 RepID=UPI001C9B6D59|nr:MULTISPECIES: ATP-binding cassette domain-containing protein [unclassified Rhodococcus (in: high G+C Gram-positive bacteria)]MBY6538506.1 ATP-binding cassette domain-containing protein [Rhodococcus sp. BP-363]MBY6542843.1 ATP-binding cassette domain-containing protein [Rhodococcus sp. BP-369]MBY6562073.1 ATP-binding cassette domain-containing protein [Rhodococcus sp. BP-370]MBY6576365.1 ATP-binding cassette domain-containing protein [Rhodococcus sp. BP-364]MBY6585666.1 ATP-binding cassette 
MTSYSPGLHGRALTRRYDDASPAVDQVTVSVAPSERVALVGASGSGKSTLLRMLLAVEAPDTGEVTLDGAVIRPGPARSTRWFRRAVQYVPQDPGSSLDPRRTVLDSVAAPLRWLRYDGDHRARALEALDSVEVAESMSDARTGELSGGQKQRVAIARALACRPRYLIADEPVSGLDLPLRDLVLDVLDTVCTRDGTASLLVTHDLAVAARTSDRLLVMADGRIVESGSTSAVLGSPRHTHTRALVDAVPRLPVVSHL